MCHFDKGEKNKLLDAKVNASIGSPEKLVREQANIVDSGEKSKEQSSRRDSLENSQIMEK